MSDGHDAAIAQAVGRLMDAWEIASLGDTGPDSITGHPDALFPLMMFIADVRHIEAGDAEQTTP